MPQNIWSQKDNRQLQEMVSRLPKYLYQYKSLRGKRMEWTREIIVDSKLYFSRPSEFNDPLDCKIQPDFKASSLAIESYWRNYLRRKNPNVRLRNFKAQNRRMVKDSKTEKGQQKLSEGVFDSLEKNGMLCLSKEPKCILMWSYYADGHKGICCRFRMDPKYLISIANIHFLLEVKYTRDFPAVNYYKAGTQEFISTILGTKARAWKHEQEWRIILPLITGKVLFPPAMLDGVILGMRISKKGEATVREWIEPRAGFIEILQIKNKPRSFDLEIQSEQPTA